MVIDRPIISSVIEQHASESQGIWSARCVLARSGHTALKHLARFDARLAAHLDGCVVSGAASSAALFAGLADPSSGAVFAAAAALLEKADLNGFEQVLKAAEALPDTFSGLVSALGWVQADRLAGVVRSLLVSESPFRRRVGIASCRVHGVHPNAALLTALHDASGAVRAEALRCTSWLGVVDLLPEVIARSTDDDPVSAFWASWSGVMLGDRAAARRLAAFAFGSDPHHERAFRLVLQAAGVDEGHELLQQVASDANQRRRTVVGSGIIGHPKYVAWLIGHMADDKLARAAGEAFSLITGADLAALKLERKPPEDFESGPNDDPDDPNVDMDPDDGLPWPDVKKVEAWWQANQSRFQKGTRYFMGQPVMKEHCTHVLKTGYQRQRILAAQYLCLLEPGTPLFNTSAPAWRQQRLLAAM